MNTIDVIMGLAEEMADTHAAVELASREPWRTPEDMKALRDLLEADRQHLREKVEQALAAQQATTCPAGWNCIASDKPAQQPDHLPDAGKMVQEPVAWMYDWGADGETVRDWISGDYEEAHSQTHNIRPLYTHPQPDDTALLQQAMEALKVEHSAVYGTCRTAAAIAALEARLAA